MIFEDDDEEEVEEEEDEDEEDSNNRRGRNSGDRNRMNNDRNSGQRGNRGKKQEPNAVTDPGLGKRYVNEYLESLSIELGEKGYETNWVHKVLGAIEGLVGKTATDKGLLTLLMAYSGSKHFKPILRIVIPNEQLVDIVAESLDGYLEGVRSAYRHSGEKVISKTDHESAQEKALGTLRAKLSETTYADVMTLQLTKDERDKFDLFAKAMSKEAESNRKFEYFRNNHLRRRADILPLLDIFEVRDGVIEGKKVKILVGAAEVMPYLERTIGKVPEPSAAKGFVDRAMKNIEDVITNITKEATEAEKEAHEKKCADTRTQIEAKRSARMTARH